MPCPTNNRLIAGCDFASFLVDQQPVYDKLILQDIRPTDGWILNVKTGTFEAYSGVQHTLDRFTSVFPDTTKVWNATQATSATACTQQCDKTEYCIGWGAQRIYYHLEEQSWGTPLLCYDQMMSVTHAREHFRQIISDILKPATSAIMSNFLRKRAVTTSIAAGTSWIANATMTALTGVFTAVGDSEMFFDCNANPTFPNVAKLTPQMLQRRLPRLFGEGYHGKMPYKDFPPLVELCLDMETTWELDRLGGSTGVGGGGNPNVVSNWRFEQWDAASKYWRYGFSGQLGNYAIRVDPMNLRFEFVRDLGAGSAPNRYRYQVVLPYVNNATGGAGGAPGLQSRWNPAFDRALFSFGIIWHKMAMEALVADATPVNPQMPFSSRNFGGRWQFVMDNLGEDVNGRTIENKRRNKGQFIADFKLAIRPLYSELCEAIFYKREPACVIAVDTCDQTAHSYPTGYNSCNTNCDGTQRIEA